MNTDARSSILLVLVCMLTCSCSQEIGFYYKINNSSSKEITNIKVFNNFYYNPEDNNRGNCIYSKEKLSSDEQIEKQYYKIGVNVPFGVLPAISYCTITATIDNNEITEHCSVDTTENNNTIVFTINDTGIEISTEP